MIFYCWRHKDQATPEAEVGEKSGQTRKRIVKLEGRTSVDTLVERRGGLDVGEKQGSQRRNDEERVRRRRKAQKAQMPQKKTTLRRGFWASLCCMSSPEIDLAPRVRPQSMPAQPKRSSAAPTMSLRTPAPTSVDLPAAVASPSSQTQIMLSYIPTSLLPQIASALLAELAKPLSGKHEEGYIYIFWLQDEEDNSPKSSNEDDPALLSPPQTPQTKHGRRTSEIVRQASVAKPRRGAGPPKILLKIGRANNVHRRMHEWARQCGYTPSLIRWYPYVPSSSPIQTSPRLVDSPCSPKSPRSLKSAPTSPSSAIVVRKIPHVHKVERLIHIELSEQRVMHRCETCGKVHREWFEIEATRKGVKTVDGLVRKWVDWAQREDLGT